MKSITNVVEECSEEGKKPLPTDLYYKAISNKTFYKRPTESYISRTLKFFRAQKETSYEKAVKFEYNYFNTCFDITLNYYDSRYEDGNITTKLSRSSNFLETAKNLTIDENKISFTVSQIKYYKGGKSDGEYICFYGHKNKSGLRVKEDLRLTFQIKNQKPFLSEVAVSIYDSSRRYLNVSHKNLIDKDEYHAYEKSREDEIVDALNKESEFSL